MTQQAVERAVDRRAQIVRLLRKLNEGLPEPGRREHPSIPGFVNEARSRTCPDCLANGRVMKTCETCRGSGTVSPARLDAVAVPDGFPDDGESRDPYADNRTQPYGVRETVKLGHVATRDAEIDRATQLARDRPKSDVEEAVDATPYVWERERAALRRRYDIDPLIAALEILRDIDPAGCALLHSVYVYGYTEFSTTLEAAVDRALVFIDERMPAPIRAPADENHPALDRIQRRWVA